MIPTLISIGPLSISSFGFFVALAFMAAVFIVWRMARFYDINEEKILDLSLLTFFGGLVGARAVFVLFNLPAFSQIWKILLITLYPGLSFWGGLIGGIATLCLLLKRTKLNFWQVTDFAALGFCLGVAIGDLGCFFGGCGYGVISSSFIAVPVAGLLDKRLPISLIESLYLFVLFLILWRQSLRFHFAGKIVSLFLIFTGGVKFLLAFYRDNDSFSYFPWLSLEHIFSTTLFFTGLTIFYRKSKRSLLNDLKFLYLLPFSSKKRDAILFSLKKNWYNFRVSWIVKSGKMLRDLKILKRRLNVKPTPKNLS